MKTIVDRRYLMVTFSPKLPAGVRRTKYRHNPCPVHSHFVRLGRLEMVLWTR